MKCQHCGKELSQGARFCDGCGAPVMQQPQFTPPQPPIQGNQPMQYQPKPMNVQQSQNKKPIYKKWWFWTLVGLWCLFVLFVIGSMGSAGDNDDSSAVTTTVSQTDVNSTTSVVTEEPTTVEPTTEKPTEKPTEDPVKVEKEFKDSCETTDFKTLSRNPDKYKGKNYKLTGEVIQVQESSWDDTVELRINITKEEFEYIDDVLWTDTIYATVEIPDGADNILVDDVITFWGTCDGEYTYTSVLGDSITLPKIDIKYYELAE